MSTPPSINILNDPGHPGVALMASLIATINHCTQQATPERPLTSGTVLDVLFSLYSQVLVNTPAAWGAVPQVQERLRSSLEQAHAQLVSTADQQAAALIARAAGAASAGGNPSPTAP